MLADIGSGHKITETVFIECGSMYRADGPTEMKSVGETEFVNGTAAMSASGQYGPTRLCRAIVGHADLRLGDGVARVLEAQITAGDGRFRGIRHSVARDASDAFPKARTNPVKGQMLDPTWRAGFARLAPLNLTFEAWLYHPQLRELADLARAYPQTTIILNHVGGPLGIGPYKDKKAETFAQWKAGIIEVAKSQNVVVKLGGLGMPIGMFDFYTREKPPSSEELATGLQALHRNLHRGFRGGSRDVRKQFSARWRELELSDLVERPQTACGRIFAIREGSTVQRHGKARLPPGLSFQTARRSRSARAIARRTTGAVVTVRPVFRHEQRPYGFPLAVCRPSPGLRLPIAIHRFRDRIIVLS